MRVCRGGSYAQRHTNHPLTRPQQHAYLQPPKCARLLFRISCRSLATPPYFEINGLGARPLLGGYVAWKSLASVQQLPSISEELYSAQNRGTYVRSIAAAR